MITETHPIISACARAILAGAVIHAGNVTAGRGRLIDWRIEPCGVEILSGADAFDQAQLLVAIVGAEVVLASLSLEAEPAQPPASTFTELAALAGSARS